LGSDVVFSIDPLRDARWLNLIDQHPKATVFHTRGWLRALKSAHGYEPIAYTTSLPTEPLTHAVVFCIVRSWLTGSRLISLPFSDHCEPLLEHSEQLRVICAYLHSLKKNERWKYVEMRSTHGDLSCDGLFQRDTTFYLHKLDLRSSLDDLYNSFQRDCIQRKIRRAQREKLTYEAGNSEALLRKLYPLFERTRLRHHVPPQPIRWFRTLIDCMGENACIRIVSKDDEPLAGILTLSHGNKVVYKYGGSDPRFHHLGSMPMLLWNAIQESKHNGAVEFDFGRSDCESTGLIAFKEHWAAERLALTHWRCSRRPHSHPAVSRKMRYAKDFVAYIPSVALRFAGKTLYRHIA
jgi:hypothetical protein